MGFSTHLQGRSAHDALLHRQDAELRLIDGIKRFLTQKIRLDKDYALGLNSLAQNGLKLVSSDDVQESLVAQAWKGWMDELESAGKAIKANCELVESKSMEALNFLYQEKRKARKTYQEEQARIVQQFTHLSEDVARKKAEYQKYLELYKLMRSRFEEHYVKSGRGGRKLDDVRDKYQKACRKLHLTHNEYVLLVCEAAEFERDYRTVLLPGVLEHQQTVQETFITSWKQILYDIHHNTASLHTSSALQGKIDSIITSIRPHDEYAKFVERHKTPPLDATVFKFEESLCDDENRTSGKLVANRLTVDNLTIEWLRTKLAELETSLKEVQERIGTMEQQKGGGDSAVNGKVVSAAASTCSSGPQQQVGETTMAACQEALLRLAETSRKEMNELKCIERKIVKQTELIRSALNELGCEEVPSGCDLPMSEQQQEKSPTSPVQPQSLQSSSATTSAACNNNEQDNDKRMSSATFTLANVTHHQHHRTSSLFDYFRKPFRRKSAPSSPVAPPRTKFTNSDNALNGNGDRKRCNSSSANPNCDDNPTIMAFSTNTSTTTTTTTPSVGGTKALIGQSQSQTLVDEEWFHGVLPREEVVRLLTQDGDFLVRETTRNDECQTVLSVCWGGHKHFIVQTTNEGHFRFEGPSFPSIRELILYQFNSQLPVTGRSGAILLKPITRERWELNNDDVVLLDKIGRGNFGDVYKAQLKCSAAQQDLVAVKTCRVTLPDEHKKKFLQEGRILKQYDHPNIVKLIGICVQKQPIMIVMELVPGGSLLTFLRKKSVQLTDAQLMNMCLDAAAGMRYLESKNCIHRDLAARNCLVGYGNVVKISDFGMSREEEEYIVSDGMKQIPIKWTAPEALNFGKYTSVCDVWSYGILCWEIFSRGDTPYAGMSNSKAREKIDAGYRMPAPENTPSEMYRLMLRCWEYQPENRPNFEEIYTVVDTLCAAYRISFL